MPSTRIYSSRRPIPQQIDVACQASAAMEVYFTRAIVFSRSRGKALTRNEIGGALQRARLALPSALVGRTEREALQHCPRPLNRLAHKFALAAALRPEYYGAYPSAPRLI